MSNIINAICNLVENPVVDFNQFINENDFDEILYETIEAYKTSCSRSFFMKYITQLFSGDFDFDGNKINLKAFSYFGGSCGFPTAILRGGDAIFIRPMHDYESELQIGEEYPRKKLSSSDRNIFEACREAETWTEKDIIYVVGVIDKNSSKLNSLAFVYGEDYCASKECYERIISPIKQTINDVTAHLEQIDSNELAHINRVDPLGITYFRVRGMWGIKNPFTVYENIYQRDETNAFNFMCIINEEKWFSFDNTSELEELAQKNKSLCISDVKIKNPDNPSRLKNAKLITFSVKGGIEC